MASTRSTNVSVTIYNGISGKNVPLMTCTAHIGDLLATCQAAVALLPPGEYQYLLKYRAGNDDEWKHVEESATGFANIVTALNAATGIRGKSLRIQICRAPSAAAIAASAAETAAIEAEHRRKVAASALATAEGAAILAKQAAAAATAKALVEAAGVGPGPAYVGNTHILRRPDDSSTTAELQRRADESRANDQRIRTAAAAERQRAVDAEQQRAATAASERQRAASAEAERQRVADATERQRVDAADDSKRVAEAAESKRIAEAAEHKRIAGVRKRAGATRRRVKRKLAAAEATSAAEATVAAEAAAAKRKRDDESAAAVAAANAMSKKEAPKPPQSTPLGDCRGVEVVLTAVFDQVTEEEAMLCIIRPTAVSKGSQGDIVSKFLEAGEPGRKCLESLTTLAVTLARMGKALVYVTGAKEECMTRALALQALRTTNDSVIMTLHHAIRALRAVAQKSMKPAHCEAIFGVAAPCVASDVIEMDSGIAEAAVATVLFNAEVNTYEPVEGKWTRQDHHDALLRGHLLGAEGLALYRLPGHFYTSIPHKVLRQMQRGPTAAGGLEGRVIAPSSATTVTPLSLAAVGVEAMKAMANINDPVNQDMSLDEAFAAQGNGTAGSPITLDGSPPEVMTKDIAPLLPAFKAAAAAEAAAAAAIAAAEEAAAAAASTRRADAVRVALLAEKDRADRASADAAARFAEFERSTATATATTAAARAAAAVVRRAAKDAESARLKELVGDAAIFVAHAEHDVAAASASVAVQREAALAGEAALAEAKEACDTAAAISTAADAAAATAAGAAATAAAASVAATAAAAAATAAAVSASGAPGTRANIARTGSGAAHDAISTAAAAVASTTAAAAAASTAAATASAAATALSARNAALAVATAAHTSAGDALMHAHGVKLQTEGVLSRMRASSSAAVSAHGRCLADLAAGADEDARLADAAEAATQPHA